MDDRALLDQIYAAPHDDDPRLVYADELDGRGDPRGELIQLQCTLASIDADDPRRKRIQRREHELLSAHGRAWLAPLAAIHDRWTFEFHRGFPEAVRADAHSLARRAGELLAAAPLISEADVDIADPAVVEDELGKLVASPLFGRLHRLTLRSSNLRIRLAGLRSAAGRPVLRALRLEEVAIAADDIAVIVEAPALAELRALEIVMSRLNRGALRPLAQLRAPLERLSLSATHAPEDVVAALTTAPGLAQLRVLAIANNEIGDDGLAAIVAAGRLRYVEELDLRSNELSEKALSSLLVAGTLGPVRKLWLASNAITNAFATKLAAWPGASQLDKLDLGGGALTDAGALALARSPKLAKLRSLVLSGVKVKQATEAALLASPHLANARLYVGARFLARG